MRLLQLNIWQGRLLRNVLNLIDQLRPDIICLQEVFSSQEVIATPEKLFNSLEIIIEQTGLDQVLFSPTFSAFYSGVKASFGNAILSRYPLLDTQTIFTNGTYVPDYNPASYNINIRNLQLATIQIDNHRFTLANHHAHWEIDPLGTAMSIEKMHNVRTMLDTKPGPIIFAGDLNVRSESPAMRVLDGLLEDLTARYNVPSTLSVVAKVSDVACDHILVSKGITVQQFKVCPELVSDHLALVLDCTFT